ncbi:Hypothetical predicted protein [Octopus vulgaris]|uniref:Uncharacterized protein n=1 Tax=Octopus vulgaris TaxID=6645 RepID=A0AA36AXM5_OCTVU|nr:Hypothetical predicted protein [Octopus vulgaris]
MVEFLLQVSHNMLEKLININALCAISQNHKKKLELNFKLVKMLEQSQSNRGKFLNSQSVNQVLLSGTELLQASVTESLNKFMVLLLACNIYGEDMANRI